MIDSVVNAAYDYFMNGFMIGMLSGTLIMSLSAIIKIFFRTVKGG